MYACVHVFIFRYNIYSYILREKKRCRKRTGVEKKKRKGERKNTNMDRRKPPSSGGRRAGAQEPWRPPTPPALVLFEKTQNTSSKTWTYLTHRGEVHKCLLDGSFFFFHVLRLFLTENTQERGCPCRRKVCSCFGGHRGQGRAEGEERAGGRGATQAPGDSVLRIRTFTFSVRGSRSRSLNRG